jgi:hypothetical protein
MFWLLECPVVFRLLMFQYFNVFVTTGLLIEARAHQKEINICLRQLLSPLCQLPSPLWIVILEKLDDKIFLVWKHVEMHWRDVVSTISSWIQPFLCAFYQKMIATEVASTRIHKLWETRPTVAPWLQSSLSLPQGCQPWTRWFWLFPWTHSFCHPISHFITLLTCCRWASYRAMIIAL